MMVLLLGAMLTALPLLPAITASPQNPTVGSVSVTATSQSSDSTSQTLACTYHTDSGPVKITYYHTTSQRCPDLILKHKHNPTDPQLGYTTTSSEGATGVNDKEVADNAILTNNIGIGQAFTDNNGNWFHNGIGENTDGTTCTNPPEIWGEYKQSGSSTYGEVALICTHYGDTSQISTVYDSHISEFAWFVNGTERASVSFSGEGSTVGTTAPIDMIETSSSSPSCLSADYTTFTHALEYSTSDANNGSPPTYTDPSNWATYNSGWPTTCWSESNSGSTPLTLTFGK